MIECSICKSHNDDRSLYCLECGQRLGIPNISNSGVTTGDMLQIPNRGDFPQRPSIKLHSPILDRTEKVSREVTINKEFGTVETSYSQIQTEHSHGSSRNGLHSPLLDEQNYFGDQYTEITTTQRLHSPVLDGPEKTLRGGHGHGWDNLPAPSEEYNSLRSPLLGAKVPLPEQNVQPDTPTPSKSDDKETSFEAPLPGKGQSSSQSFESITITGVTSPNRIQTTHNSLLPNIAEEPETQITDKNRTSSEIITVPLILFVLGFKSWYLISLGSTVFSSMPFLFDQIGQILVILVLLILILTLKF